MRKKRARKGNYKRPERRSGRLNQLPWETRHTFVLLFRIALAVALTAELALFMPGH
jgi:hypothetical protein